MIDNPTQVNTLMQKMKQHLPIPTQATNELIHNLRKNGIKISSKSSLQIVDVLYLGDDGGIACALKIQGQEESAVVVSVTHLRFSNSNPLAVDLKEYQIARTKKIDKSQ